MNSTTVYYYRLYCNTESVFVNVWSPTTPTVCPNNNSHTIDNNSITILNNISNTNVYVQNNNTSNITGNYRTESYSIFCSANSTQVTNYTWPINIGVTSVFFNLTSDHTGDIINSIIAPNTTIGYITQNLSTGSNLITVNPGVFTNINKGYLINITDGTNGTNLGQALTLNTTNNTILCELTSGSNFITGNYVQMGINNVRNFVLQYPGSIRLKSKGSTSSFVPANITVQVSYKNLSLSPKTFIWGLQYLY